MAESRFESMSFGCRSDQINSKSIPLFVAQAFGGVVLRDPTGKHAPASYDHSNLRYNFLAPAANRGVYALDVERRDARLDSLLEKVLSTVSPKPALQTWTLIEVIAKLQNQPVHLVMRQVLVAKELSPEIMQGVIVEQPDHPHLWITVGLFA
jgi:hypothetical protein